MGIVDRFSGPSLEDHIRGFESDFVQKDLQSIPDNVYQNFPPSSGSIAGDPIRAEA
jgi:hypothetical protein